MFHLLPQALNQVSGCAIISKHQNHSHPTRASRPLCEAAEVRESATLCSPALSHPQLQVPASLCVRPSSHTAMVHGWLIHQKICPEKQLVQQRILIHSVATKLLHKMNPKQQGLKVGLPLTATAS